MNNKSIEPYSAKQERFGTWLINRIGRWQIRVYEWSGGRLWKTFLGAPVAILTTVGRKSGLERKVPLLYLMHGDSVVMTASKGGMSTLPVWYLNVKAHPEVGIQVGKQKRRYRMREANAQEETELWPKLEAMYPDYREYRQRTATIRRIPVLIFDPIG